MKTRFIFNPVSGNKPLNPENLKSKILTFFEGADFVPTQGPGHATQLAQEAADSGFDTVVAIGGDGTVNETARGLINTQTALGIIPMGSGNGFARELGLMGPLDKTLNKLKNAMVRSCDVGYANGELFLNVAGVGIEAVVAWKFMEQGKKGKRGMIPYFKLAAQTFFNYKPPLIHVTLNGKTHHWMPLTLAFANNRQYGSNFIIAPKASISDGKLNMVVVSNLSKYKVVAAIPYFFMGKKPPFNLTGTAELYSAVVESEQEILYHVDGEPRKTARHLEITMEARALKVLVA